jgi:hypothetical protein
MFRLVPFDYIFYVQKEMIFMWKYFRQFIWGKEVKGVCEVCGTKDWIRNIDEHDHFVPKIKVKTCRACRYLPHAVASYARKKALQQKKQLAMKNSFHKTMKDLGRGTSNMLIPIVPALILLSVGLGIGGAVVSLIKAGAKQK